jgi:tRNA pseudouridine55 synthase
MNAPRTRVQRRPVHGLLLLDKPLGMSSNHALQKAKYLLRAEKAGHTGTLDPLASGVLPLCFGAATKFSQIHLDADKAYEAVAKMGQTTSTGDAEGEVLAQCEATFSSDDLRQVEQTLSGPIQQTPPMHSALKKDGKALYEYAREGLTVERASRAITIHSLRLQEIEPQAGQRCVRMWVDCSKGTYIRTLAEDMGKALGCGAHLISLRRTRSGPFGVADCITLEQLEAMADDQRQAQLRPVDSLLQGHQPITLEPHDSGRFLSGLRRRGAWPDCEHVSVYGQDPHSLLGTAHVKAGELIPTRLLSPLEIKSLLENPA